MSIIGGYRHVEVPIGGGRDFYPDLAEVGKDFIEDEGICFITGHFLISK
jgi:hypothetical protein